MKKILIARRSWLMAWSTNPLTILLQAELTAPLAIAFDWYKLPYAVIGASMAMLKARKDDKGQIIHKSFIEWLLHFLTGAAFAMVAWRDTQNIINSLQKAVTLSAELSTVLAGLLAWLFVEYILKQAKKKTTDDPTNP